ncbi:hypothetical protein Bca52824_049052 [Brassica carinata]|uniref:Pentatricopeptide repeat-containing protein n=1 Tax=Brassica carinata TaxID=52824 RepID=A0A8X7RHV1_BRACI|nr:hypothetical protein Bca52824_049052 [Brassica carinata]
MRDKSLSVREDHYTCLVDLCGRAGRLKDVLKFINSVEAKPSGSVYGAVLSACNVHGEVSIAKEEGKMEEAAEMRMKMKERGLKKPPGCSWIRLEFRMHAFVVGDLSHPQFEALDWVVTDLSNKMRKNKNMTSEVEEDEFLAI